MLNPNFLYHLPKTQKSCAPFPMYAWRGRALCEHRSSPAMQEFPRLFPPRNPAAITQQSLPPSISPRARPILAGLWHSRAPEQGEAPGFPGLPSNLSRALQGESFEMFIKWPSLAAKQSESHSAAKSQQHGGARAAQTGDISLFQGKKNCFFPFPKKLVSVLLQPHATHTEFLPLKLLHCEEKSLSWFTANAWEVLEFRSTYHNNRKPHYGWNSFL